MPVVQVTIADQAVPMETVVGAVVPAGEVGEGGFEAVAGALGHAGGTLADFVQSACSQVYAAMARAVDTVKPDHVEVAFGVAVGGEAGVPFLVKGALEGNLAITLAWDLAARRTLAADPGDAVPGI